MIQWRYHQAGGATVLTKSKNLKLDGLPLLEGLRTGEKVMMMMAPYFHSQGMCDHDASSCVNLMMCFAQLTLSRAH